MRLLYLVRHASPQVQPEVPSRDWGLSDRGVDEAQALAGAAVDWELAAIYASSEAKARQTALILGDAAGLAVGVADAFDELRIHDWIDNSDEFNDLVRAIFEGADLGRVAEPAAEAAARFAAGVRIVEAGPLPAAVVSHGRIITSWLASIGAVEEPFVFWRTIPMPGWAVIDLDNPRAGLRSPFARA